jgi:protein-tyrosine phosphatase
MTENKSISILFVCHGNICRSPAAEGTFKHLVNKKGLSQLFKIDSAGTASYHTGEQPHTTTVNVAGKRGITLDHRARQFKKKDFDEFDYILTMDQINHEDIVRQSNGAIKALVMKFRYFDPVVKNRSIPPDVPDPFYGGKDGFEGVQDIMDRTAEGLLNWIMDTHHLR